LDITVTYCPGLDFESQISSVVGGSMNSEGLLKELESFDKKGKRVAIFRGQDGRECIGPALKRDGAVVEYIESYRRVLTTQSFDPILTSWKDKPFDVVLITSVSILKGLMALLGEKNAHLLKQSTVLTISERIAEVCKDNGLKNVVVTRGPSEVDITSGLNVIRGVM